MRRPLAIAWLPLLLLLLGGCVEVEESWEIRADGGGTYGLRVRWRADIAQSLAELAGREVAERVAGRPFPLRARAWREGLRDLEGVRILHLDERSTEDGGREITLRAAFRRPSDLLAWEVLGRRPMRLGRVPAGAEGQEAAALEMAPLADLPRLGPLVALVAEHEAARRRPGAEGRPSPAERLGLEARTADLLATVLASHLARARFAFRFRLPRAAHEADGGEVEQDGRLVVFRGDGADPGRRLARGLRLAWRPAPGDVLPLFEQAGEEPAPAPSR